MEENSDDSVVEEVKKENICLKKENENLKAAIAALNSMNDNFFSKYMFKVSVDSNCL